MKLSVIMPVYNEVNTIREIIAKVKGVAIPKEIIIVDDGSSDGTKEILKNINEPDIKVHFHEKNKGKGGSVRTALKYVTGDIVIIQDADMEYDPNEYPDLIKPIEEGAADVVYGSRLCGGKPQRVHMFWHMMGNRFITFVANILYNNTLTDIETGYKAFRKEVVSGLNLRCNGFSIEPEITAKIFKKEYRVYEMPISYYGRNYKEGKKINWRHGFSAICTLIWYRFFN